MIDQTVPPFKLEKADNSISAHAGLALLSEVGTGVDLLETIDKNSPIPGGGASYRAGS